MNASLAGEVLWWLRQEDEGTLDSLRERADRTRARTVGEEVHLRGLLEFSNACERTCTYCGLRRPRRDLPRYHMTDREILGCADEAYRMGMGTLLLQSGEYRETPIESLVSTVRAIRQRTEMAIALSVGERSPLHYRALREAGADRYLLKFETSDAVLMDRIHPPRVNRTSNRLHLLMHLKRLGFEVASGIMVGIPGQTWASVARDILLFRALDLDMIAVGPYIPHPRTPLCSSPPASADQVPATACSCLKVIALSRLVRPDAHIPATRAMAVSVEKGYGSSLDWGADVVMVNLTPDPYRSLYDPYPGGDTPSADLDTVLEVIRHAGRIRGRGRGDRRFVTC